MAVDKEAEFTMEIRDAPPAHLLLKIESFSTLSERGIMKLESREFVVGIYKWKLIVCSQDSGGSNTSVFLSVAETESLPKGWQVTADCSILLHNMTSDDYFCFRGKAQRFDAKNSRWGFSISGKMLAEVCDCEDNCTFGADVFLSETHMNKSSSFHGWKISDFSKLGDTIWNSQEFLAGGFKWKVKVYPNGNEERDAKGKSVSIYLERVDSKTFAPPAKVKADFSIRIKNKLPHHALNDASKWTHHLFSSKEPDWGFSDFIPIADMRDPSKGFIINDCCFLEVEISVLIGRGWLLSRCFGY